MKRNDSSDSFEHQFSHCSPPLRIPLGAIRRKLWILDTKLQSLPAKIESMYRQSGEGNCARGSNDACVTELHSLKNGSMEGGFSGAGRPDGTAKDSGHGRIEPNVAQPLR